jgi:hypothetical protein
MATEDQASSGNLMTFYDNYTAPLTAGSYRLVLQQTVSVEGEASRHYYQDQPFEVLAPRYAIEGSEIQAYFPPSGGVGDYQNVLPHLVLRARNLPWERSVWPGEGREPWLALLVLSEQDILSAQVTVKMGTVGDLVAQQKSAASWARAEGGATILLPKFDREKEDLQAPVRLLDLDLKLFLQLCPRREELPLLAHIRHVDTANKIPLEMVADGEFSVLVANRFPSPGANTIHLISLEGWHDLLAAPEAAPKNIPRVRLITLASWSFVRDPGGQDTFGGLMQRLRKNTALFSVALPAPADDAYVNRALARGYVPVDYQPLESTQTFAWYRGPLAPVIRGPLKQPAFRRADAALIFDDSTGIMDVSYAAAWELGRLLALASPAFAKSLRLFVERCHNAAEFAQQIATFLKLHHSAIADQTLKNAPPPVAEPLTIADELVQWIAQLVLLYPVPFHYLLPHPLLLPPESLRFFHLDNNWVDALVDGALSIAVRNLADQGVASRDNLQSALSKIVYQHRLRLQDKPPEAHPSEGYMESPKSGFLLRSSVVTGWPGVEIKATTSTTLGDDFPDILRFDQIADGVLFCLARGSLKEVIFREPREGLTFGVNSDGAIETRKAKKNLNVRKDFARPESGDGVVDIAALRSKLVQLEWGNQGLRENNFGSAEFALQMIRRPEEQVIGWA